MKKIFLLIFVLFFITSCKEDVKEVGQIMDDYVDTLETSITDSKEVRDLMNQNNDDFKNAINNAKK